MVSDIGGVLVYFVRTGLLPALVVGLVAAVLMAVLARRRGWTQWSLPVTAMAIGSMMGVLVFTLLRESVPVLQRIASGGDLAVPGWRGLTQFSDGGWWRLLTHPSAVPRSCSTSSFRSQLARSGPCSHADRRWWWGPWLLSASRSRSSRR